jgi:hypothetical protein
MSLLEVRCPCCNARLWLDPAAGKVVDHQSTERQKIELDEFLEAQKHKSSEWDDKLKKARRDEERRKKEWEARFKQATENPDQLKDDYHSPFEWD